MVPTNTIGPGRTKRPIQGPVEVDVVELAVVLVHQEAEDQEEVVIVPVDPKGQMKILLHGLELSAKTHLEGRNSLLYLVHHNREKKERVGPPIHRLVTGEIMQLLITLEETVVGIISPQKDPFHSGVVVVDELLKNAISPVERLVRILLIIYTTLSKLVFIFRAREEMLKIQVMLNLLLESQSVDPEIIIRPAETMVVKELLNSVQVEVVHPVEEALSSLVVDNNDRAVETATIGRDRKELLEAPNLNDLTAVVDAVSSATEVAELWKVIAGAISSLAWTM